MERQPHRRRRPALSCLECRRRKIKCDRNDPCAHCVSAKTRCTFKVYSSEPVTQQQLQQGSSWNSAASPLAEASLPFAQAQLISTNGPILEHMNNTQGPQVTAVAAAGQNDGLGHDHIEPLKHAQNDEPDVRDLLRRVRRLEESSAASPNLGLTETGRDILAQQSGLQVSQIILNKTRILRWTHWMGMAQEVWSA